MNLIDQKFEIQSAALVFEPANVGADPGLTPAQKRGLKYQARVEKELSRLYNGRTLLRPWFRYKSDWKVKRCQPDVLIFTEKWDHCSVLEIKYSTIPEAWEKLSQLYAPVVQKAYRIPISLVLITRMFDPAIGFPCQIKQLEGLERLGDWNGEGLGVVSWK